MSKNTISKHYKKAKLEFTSFFNDQEANQGNTSSESLVIAGSSRSSTFLHEGEAQVHQGIISPDNTNLTSDLSDSDISDEHVFSFNQEHAFSSLLDDASARA